MLGLLFPFFLIKAISILPPGGMGTIEEIIESITEFLLLVVVITTPCMVLYGAYLIMISHGDAKRLQEGRNYIFYAAIGLAVALSVRGIVSLVIWAIGVPTT